MPDSGPGRFTFDVSTGALLTTGGGGGGTQNVNITEVNGNPVAMGNPLPVELSDGTNPFGTNANPIFAVGPTSNTANAPAQTAVSNSASTILAANASRLEATIVNTGTTVIYLAFNGQTPTATAYHVALAACGTANDGTGGTYTTDIVKGAIKAISATSGTVCVTELTA